MSIPQNKIGFVSLGCPKALVDSERIITQLRAEGYDLVPNYEKANLVIVNTCGFIAEATEESLSSIGEALEKNGKVIVTGCLGTRANVITDRYPEVLKVTGPQGYEDVMDAVHEHLPQDTNPFTNLIPLPPQGIKLTPRHYAYLKVAEGCNHGCTFCIIPSLRGKLKSRPIDSVLHEAERLHNAGVKELLIIAQDTSAYGVDIKYLEKTWKGNPVKTRFYELVQALGEFGIWIRLHYVYPYPHVDAIIPLMQQGKILPYLDIPLQHASQRILKLMKRPASSENNLTRIQAWREICPDMAIRSTFIVGFPGETEEDFQELLDFLQAAQLDRVGCFKYSPIDTAKANELPNPVPEEIKQQRYDRFMQLQAKISKLKLKQKIGKTLPVLIDEVSKNSAKGRTSADAPEIDGAVHIKNCKNIVSGQIVNVVIEKSDAYDLYGRLD